MPQKIQHEELVLKDLTQIEQIFTMKRLSLNDNQFTRFVDYFWTRFSQRRSIWV